MLFTDDFIENLRDDPVRGTIDLCDFTINKLQSDDHEGWTEGDLGVLIEAYSLLG